MIPWWLTAFIDILSKGGQPELLSKGVSTEQKVHSVNDPLWFCICVFRSTLQDEVDQLKRDINFLHGCLEDESEFRSESRMSWQSEPSLQGMALTWLLLLLPVCYFMLLLSLPREFAGKNAKLVSVLFIIIMIRKKKRKNKNANLICLQMSERILPDLNFRSHLKIV